MDDDARALRAQIEALTAAVQALTVAQRPSASFAGSLAALLELHEATWPRGASWKVSRRASLMPAANHFGARAAAQLGRQDWIVFRDKVRAEQTTLRKGKPAATTLNYELACWRGVYRWALAERMLVENPLVGIKPIKAKKHRQTEPTDDDVQKLRPHLDADGWAYTLLGQRRGLRASEARKLEWPNVDLERGRIGFVAAKTHVWVTMRIPSDVVEALRAIRPDVPGRYVFPSPRRPSQPVHATTLWFKFRNAADIVRLQAADGDGHVVFHDTRHGFTSGMARKNPLPVAMRMSRHAGYRSAQRYMHVNESDLEGAYETLEAGARKPPKKSADLPTEHVGGCKVTGE